MTLGMFSQRLLRHPLWFVPADSVIFFDTDATNLAATALAVDASLQARPYADLSRRQAQRVIRRGLPKADRDGDVFAAADFFNRAAPLLRWTSSAQLAADMDFLIFHRLIPAAQVQAFGQHVAAQALRSAAGMIYMTDEKGVYVNVLSNCFARIKTAHLDLAVDQITGMPYRPQVRFRISRIPTQTPLVLRVRLPEGTTIVPSLFVNGHPETHPVQEGYLVITRRWNAGDEVWFELDRSMLLHE